MKRYNALYTRESTKQQAEQGFNLEMQFKKGKGYCELYNFDGDIKLYEEFGYSAKTTNRPKLNQLKKDIIEGKVKRVIVFKLDRLIRRLSGLKEMLDLFEMYDVEFISICENIDTKTAIGRMMIYLITLVSQWEEDTISERTLTGYIEGTEQGYYIFGGLAPFGYERKKVENNHYVLKVIDEEKKILRKMSNLLKEGYSSYLISLIVNNESYMKKVGKKLCEDQITRNLQKKIYAGIVELNNKEYKINMESIYTEKEIEEHIELLKTREHSTKYNYLFDKKVCSKDGNFAMRKSTIKKNGIYLYYVDEKSKNRINENKIVEEVIEYIKHKKILYNQHRNRSYDNDLKRLERLENKMILLHTTKQIDDDTYLKECSKINKEYIKVQKAYELYIEFPNEYFNSLSFDEKFNLINRNVKKIEVDFDTKQIINIS